MSFGTVSRFRGEKRLLYSCLLYTSGDEIHLEDDDYGVWFIDAMERPELYDGKTMVMKTRVFKAMRMPKGTFVPGRHAMTCCADDIQFIGYLCHTNHAKSSTIKSLKNKMWITLTAEVKVEYNEEYKDKGPVSYTHLITLEFFLLGAAATAVVIITVMIGIRIHVAVIITVKIAVFRRIYILHHFRHLLPRKARSSS